MGKIRKQLNTLFVFLCSGLWHGAAWHFVAWGGLNGLASVLEDIFSPFVAKVLSRLRIDTNRIGFRVLRRFYTFIIVDTTWLFFRATSLRSGLQILKKIITEYHFGWITNLNIISMFSDSRLFVVIVSSLLLLCAVDYTKYRKLDVKEIIFQQQIVFRWILYIGLLMLILFWGVYGNDYEQTQFIYFQF